MAEDVHLQRLAEDVVLIGEYPVAPVADADAGAGLEHALDDHGRQDGALADVVGGETRQTVEVDRIHGDGRGQARQIRRRPEAAVPVDLRHGGDLRGIDGAAVGDGQLADDKAVRAEADLHRTKAFGKTLHFAELAVTDRRGGLIVADAVHAAEGVADEGVVIDEQIFILAVRPSADRAAAGDRLVKIDDRAAFRHALALTRDAADVFASVYETHRIAGRDDGFGLPDDPAAVVAARLDVAVVFGRGDHAQLCQTADAAVKVLFGGYEAVVEAFSHDAAREVGVGRDLYAVGNVGRKNAFKVEFGLDAHRAGNAADVCVAVDLAVVGAEKDLAVHILIRIQIGDILHNAQLQVARKRVGEHREDVAVMGVDALHVTGKAGERAVDRAAHVIEPGGERGELRPHAGVLLLHRGQLGVPLRVAQVDPVDQVGPALYGETAARVDQLFLVRIGHAAVGDIADRVVAQRIRRPADSVARAGGGVPEVVAALLLLPLLGRAGLLVDRFAHVVVADVRAAVADLLRGGAESRGVGAHVAHSAVHGRLQSADLVGERGGIVQDQIGLHLSDDAAHVLAAEDRAVV